MSSPKRSSPLRPVFDLPSGPVTNLIELDGHVYADNAEFQRVELTVQDGICVSFPIDDPVLGIPGILDDN